MTKTNLFVDGYNIIGDWDYLIELKEIDLSDAREKLIDELSEFQALSLYKVVLVFDGHLVKNSKGSREMIRGIEVIYTKEGITADMTIERLVSQLPKYHKTYVATSDRLEQELILSKGALRISARELRILVDEAKSAMKEEVLGRMPSVNTRRNTLDSHLSESQRQALKKLMK